MSKLGHCDWLGLYRPSQLVNVLLPLAGNVGEKVLCSAWNYTTRRGNSSGGCLTAVVNCVPVRLSSKCSIRLPRSCLSVAKDASVKATADVFHNIHRHDLVHLLLRQGGPDDIVKGVRSRVVKLPTQLE